MLYFHPGGKMLQLSKQYENNNSVHFKNILCGGNGLMPNAIQYIDR